MSMSMSSVSPCGIVECVYVPGWSPLHCYAHPSGETAGLRVPRAGLNQHKQPLWMCHGCLFRSARPELNDTGGEAREEGPAAMDRFSLPLALACTLLL